MHRWILPVTATALLIAPVFAQNRPLACQADRAAGLEWERGEWVTKQFKPEPAKFILIMSGEVLTPESVAKALLEDGYPRTPRCEKELFSVICRSGIGLPTFLYFSPISMTGGISHLSGSAHDDKFGFKSPVTVSTFTCQPF